LLLIDLSFEISNLRCFPVLRSYPKQVWNYLKQKLFITVPCFNPIPVLGMKVKQEERNLVILEDIPINNHINGELSTRHFH